jgi:Ca2+-binding RTX toxin-like protein
MALIQGTRAGDVLTGGADHDTIYSAQSNDTLFGEGGNDVLYGGNQNDSLHGGLGDDTLFGGNGRDYLIGVDELRALSTESNIMRGGAGGDVYVVRSTADKVIEGPDGGYDRIYTIFDVWPLPPALEEVHLGDYFEDGVLKGPTVAIGNEKNNRIFGNFQDNLLKGLDGDDRLYGGEGDADTLNGGRGNDTLEGEQGNILLGGPGDDVYQFSPDSMPKLYREIENAGFDTIMTSSHFRLGENFEGLWVTGNRPWSGYGNQSDNFLKGNNEGNYLFGGEGNDTLEGTGGANKYVMNTALGSDNVDTIAHLSSEEQILLHPDVFGALADQAGNDLDTGSFVTGSSAADADDHIIYDDTTGEFFYDPDGTGAIDQILFARLEYFYLDTFPEPTAKSFKVYEEVGLLINGSGSRDDLIGTPWDDSINGGGNSDELYGLSGDDQLDGGSYSDELYGDTGNDTLLGRDGDDELYGGSGDDLMSGGTGNDTYWIDSIGDVVIEEDTVGTSDLVRSHINIGALHDRVEDLRLLDGAARVGNGNASDNRIFGNDSDNYLRGFDGDDSLDGGWEGDHGDTLKGGAGDDTLEAGEYMMGGSGDDVYYVVRAQNLDAVIIEGANSGTDLVLSNVSYRLGAHVENLELDSFGHNNAIGNKLDNQLEGDQYDNVLNGREGNDTLTGNIGADTFVFSRDLGPNNVDTITDMSGNDTILLHSNVFSALSTGALAPSALVFGGAATDGDDRIIYDQTTGQLFYDADGTGAAAQILFAELEDKAMIAADMFSVA